MDNARRKELLQIYRDGLLRDTIPFWLKHGLDREYGGVMTCLNRDGTVVDTDKNLWQQGRFAWLMATLYNTVERRGEWLEAARSTLDFIVAHGFDEDGRLLTPGHAIEGAWFIMEEAFSPAPHAMVLLEAAGGNSRRMRRPQPPSSRDGWGYRI